MCTYGFGLQLATLHADHSAFSRAKLAGPFEFSVRHYAGEVLYHAEGFLDKNRDSVGEACRDLLAKSSVPLVSVVVVWLVVLAGVGGWRVRGGGERRIGLLHRVAVSTFCWSPTEWMLLELRFFVSCFVGGVLGVEYGPVFRAF